MSVGARHLPRRIWRWPIMLALLTMFGLLSALIGQGGVWWVLSWIMLTIPLLVIVVCATGLTWHWLRSVLALRFCFCRDFCIKTA